MDERGQSCLRVLYVQYTNPAGYPPLEHSSRILADRGWQVLFLGTGAHGADALRFSPHERITTRQMRFQAAGWQQKMHYMRFCAWSVGWALRWRPRYVYASDLLSCPVALILSYFPRMCVIYHEHDSPSSGATSRLMRLCLRARRKVARRAAMIILPSEARAQQFTATTGAGERIRCVLNCPTLDEVGAPRMPIGQAGLKLVYHGSIVPARLPQTVLRAMALLPQDVTLRVVGYETVGHRGYVRELMKLAKCLGIEDRLEFVGALPTRRDLYRSVQECDIGLALMPLTSDDGNERWMMGASNKPFDYLACGLAVLVSDLPDWRKCYVDGGYGLACNPECPESIAAAIRQFMANPAETRAVGERGRQKILSEWNYERQFAPVSQIFNG